MSEADTEPDVEAEVEPETESEESSESAAPLLDEIQLVEPDSLIPYHNNPKEHPEWQIDKLASSIKAYGFDQPIVVDNGNEIIKGHGRLKAAKKIGLDEVPVIKREDLSNAQAKASRIADNKTHMDTGWDMESLALEFEEIEDEGLDPTLTGFEDEEYSAIIEEQDFDIDEFFEAEEDGEFVDDVDEDDGGGPPPGEVECPECGHHFAPTMDEVGEREESGGSEESDGTPPDEEIFDDASEPIDTGRPGRSG